MISVLIPFRMTTAAVRGKADLWERTRSLRATSRVTEGMRSAGFQLPLTLLGGELLATMSAQLQELLRGNPAAEHGNAVGGQGHSFETEERREAHRREWAAPMIGQHAFGFQSVTAMTAKASLLTPSRPAKEEASNIGQTADGTLLPVPERNAKADSLPIRETTGTRSNRAMRVGTIFRQVREYWNLERDVHKPRRAGGVEAEARAPGAVEKELNPNAEPRTRRRESNVALIQRLRSFISGPSNELTADRPNWTANSGMISQAASLTESSLRSPAGAPALDFADHLASVLRWQATQHGIDLT